MNLKKQIAVIVLALTATTSPVWSQDRQALPSSTAHTLHGTWRVTRTAVDCITGQDILSFPAIMTFNQGGTYTGYGVPPGGDPGQGTEYGVWQREPGSQNYSVRSVSYGYTAEARTDERYNHRAPTPFRGRGALAEPSSTVLLVGNDSLFRVARPSVT